MSDRILREPANAWQMLMRDFAGRLRRLERRAWPGAARTLAIANRAQATQTATLGTLTVPSGSWMVHLTGWPTLASVPADMTVTLSALYYEAGTATSLASATNLEPVGRVGYASGAPVATTARSIAGLGWITSDVDIDVTIVGASSHASSFPTWTSVRLALTPF